MISMNTCRKLDRIIQKYRFSLGGESNSRGTDNDEESVKDPQRGEKIVSCTRPPGLLTWIFIGKDRDRTEVPLALFVALPFSTNAKPVS